MKLSRYTLKNISSKKVAVPQKEIFELPEKVLQFGTGRLLRGLPDYFIDKANREGIFNGRVVMVKSTSNGDITSFNKQDCLYTLCERGIRNGKNIKKYSINSSISRVIDANKNWGEVLHLAHNEDLQIIISNTTEVGVQLVNDNILNSPPVSYPGKLLAFLYERFKAFKGDKNRGFVIVPTELITQNGKVLESAVMELAHLNSLEENFIEWIECSNHFCNSLVDRIVTGMPVKEIKDAIENELGYVDDLLVVSETYSLWAIEGDKKIKDILSFARADKSVIIEPDITNYRELKLRLLNGTHTFTCGVAFLAGCDKVREAMDDALLTPFITNIMKKEIALSLPSTIDKASKEDFIVNVSERFANPHIEHFWKSITLNYTSKMRIRCVPLLLAYYEKRKEIPHLMTLGFAAYLYFMKPVKKSGKDFYGEYNGEQYLIEDEMASWFHMAWAEKNTEDFVKKVLKNNSLWDCDLSLMPMFQKQVTRDLKNVMKYGMKKMLQDEFAGRLVKS